MLAGKTCIFGPYAPLGVENAPKIQKVLMEAKRSESARREDKRRDPRASLAFRHSKKVRFSPDQDEIIRRNAERNPPNSWAQIAKLIPGKNAKQCRERYQHFLSPELTRPPWTLQEDYNLIQYFKRFGSNWAKIATLFPGRTNHDVKNRWNGHLKGHELDVFLSQVSQRSRYQFTEDQIDSSWFSDMPELQLRVM